MIVIEPSFEILKMDEGLEALKLLELGGRVCYKSEDKITDDSCLKFINMIKTVKHESVLEHCSASVRIICNRGVTHELVRHRLASFSQESTRYVNYGKRGMQVVKPVELEEGTIQYSVWHRAMERAEESYNMMIELGAKPQIARGVLPIDVKTEIVVTANFRQWMHIFNLRCANNAHPDIRFIMKEIRDEFRKRVPILFDSTVEKE